MNIRKYSKSAVLAALYNGSRQQGMGLVEPNSGMTEDEAQELLDNGQTYFDYLRGRVMKVDLSGDDLDTGFYNRDNGPNAAEDIILSL